MVCTCAVGAVLTSRLRVMSIKQGLVGLEFGALRLHVCKYLGRLREYQPECRFLLCSMTLLFFAWFGREILHYLNIIQLVTRESLFFLFGSAINDFFLRSTSFYGLQWRIYVSAYILLEKALTLCSAKNLCRQICYCYICVINICE